MSETAVKDEAPAPAPVEEAVAVEVEAVAEATATTSDAVETSGEVKEDAAKPNAKAPENMLRTRGTIDRENYANNRKFNPATLPETDDPVQIRAQTEFYFSDSNLPGDKYMMQLTGGEENKPVKLKDICSFKRMHRFQPYTAVVAALREDGFFIVEGEEGEETIKRKVPYVHLDGAQQSKMAATVYVKGFGDEEPTTQFDIEAFFAKYGPVNQIRLRRTAEKFFKGSVFVEFQSEELAKKFLELDPTPTWKEHDLKIMPKKDYINEKNQLINDGKIQPSHSNNRSFRGRGRGRGRGFGRDNRGRQGNGDPNDWKTRREQDQKNGFKDRNGHRGRGHGGRGGRGRNDRDGRNDRSREDPKAPSTNNVERPSIQATDDKGAVVENGSANGKRSREDDGGAEPPAKKANTNTETAAASS